MSTLKVDISKKLGRFTLRSRFEVSSDRFALLGPSGCGKTMTLKCIAGIERPDEGTIILGDKVLFDSGSKIDLPPRERKVGYLFQDYALFPHMTAFDNINIICRDNERTEQLLHKFDLTSVRNNRPGQMSGGQCQRTALARMLASDPEVILLDEPFSALDNYLHSMIEREILDILDDFEGPAVLVSHDRNEVYRICDTVAVMSDGEVTAIQDRKSFFEHPVDTVSARLTGCKNISRITQDQSATDWGIRLNLPDMPDNTRYVGYRAHYFEQTDTITENVIEAQIVRVIRDTFSTTVLFRQHGSEQTSSDSILTWITDSDRADRLECGQVLYLKLDPSKIMFFER